MKKNFNEEDINFFLINLDITSIHQYREIYFNNSSAPSTKAAYALQNS